MPIPAAQRPVVRSCARCRPDHGPEARRLTVDPAGSHPFSNPLVLPSFSAKSTAACKKRLNLGRRELADLIVASLSRGEIADNALRLVVPRVGGNWLFKNPHVYHKPKERR